MAELLADDEAGPMVLVSLLRMKRFSGRATRRRRYPTGQFLIALLGIGMPQSMHFGQAGTNGMTLVDSKLLDIVAVAGNQRAFTSQSVSTIQNLPLPRRSNRKASCLAALGPGRFQNNVIALIGISGHEFNCLFPPQAKSCLQFKTHTHMLIAHFLKLRSRH